MKKILMILAPKDFRDEEYFVPKKRFEEAGFKIDVASVNKGTCYGKLGGTIQADLSLEEVIPDNYGAVTFVGGGGSSVYFDDKSAHKIAKAFYEAKKIVSAICIAPMILVNSGILTGKNATCYPSEKDAMLAKGINCAEKDVVVDGTIVTANGPAAAEAFADAIINLLV